MPLDDRLRADLEQRLESALQQIAHLRELRLQIPDDSSRAQKIDADLKTAEIDAGRLQALLADE